MPKHATEHIHQLFMIEITAISGMQDPEHAQLPTQVKQIAIFTAISGMQDPKPEQPPSMLR